MKNTPAKTQLNQDEEAAIQAIVDKMCRQISQVVTDALVEMLSTARQVRQQSAMRQADHQQDEFLTAVDVAKILKISRALAYGMIKKKAIPSFSMGRTVRVRRDDLAAFIQAHTVRTSLF